MADKIILGCRLPHGITLRHPMYEDDRTKDVHIRGLNKATVIGSTYVTTDVDKEFWELWEALHHGKFAALKNGALFVASTVSDASVVARDLEKEKTGFELLNPESHGVKKADKE